jgi:hypothetical protein
MIEAELLIWSWGGITFARTLGGNDQQFPQQQAIASVEPLIGGGMYRDLGGVRAGQFTLVAAFSTPAERTSMINKVGEVSSLTKTLSAGAQSLSMMLMSAEPLFVASGVYIASLVFE